MDITNDIRQKVINSNILKLMISKIGNNFFHESITFFLKKNTKKEQEKISSFQNFAFYNNIKKKNQFFFSIFHAQARKSFHKLYINLNHITTDFLQQQTKAFSFVYNRIKRTQGNKNIRKCIIWIVPQRNSKMNGLWFFFLSYLSFDKQRESIMEILSSYYFEVSDFIRAMKMRRWVYRKILINLKKECFILQIKFKIEYVINA